MKLPRPRCVMWGRSLTELSPSVSNRKASPQRPFTSHPHPHPHHQTPASPHSISTPRPLTILSRARHNDSVARNVIALTTTTTPPPISLPTARQLSAQPIRAITIHSSPSPPADDTSTNLNHALPQRRPPPPPRPLHPQGHLPRPPRLHAPRPALPRQRALHAAHFLRPRRLDRRRHDGAPRQGRQPARRRPRPLQDPHLRVPARRQAPRRDAGGLRLPRHTWRAGRGADDSGPRGPLLDRRRQPPRLARLAPIRTPPARPRAGQDHRQDPALEREALDQKRFGTGLAPLFMTRPALTWPTPVPSSGACTSCHIISYPAIPHVPSYTR